MSGNSIPARQQVTADAAFRELLAGVIRSGMTHTSGPASHNSSRPIRELVHGNLEFDQLPHRLVGCSGPGAWISPGLAAARFLYLLTGRRDLKFIAPFSGGVRQFSADGTDLGGSAYGAKLFGEQPGTDQIRRCAEIIASRPNTKRAAVTLFPPYTGNETSVDVACCLGIVFMPRSGTLDASVIMRANDAMRLLPYNLFEFSMLAELVARLTRLEAGTYRHLAVSMHLRGDGDLKLASEFCAGPAPCGTVDMGRMPDLTWDTVTALASLGNALSDFLSEPELFEDRAQEILTRSQSLAGPYWRDVIAAAAARGLARRVPEAKCERLFEQRGLVSGPLLSAELTYQRRTLPRGALTSQATRQAFLPDTGEYGRNAVAGDARERLTCPVPKSYDTDRKEP
jgi:hypothetical protein